MSLFLLEGSNLLCMLELVPHRGELYDPVGLDTVKVSVQAPTVDDTWVTKLVKSSLFEI